MNANSRRGRFLRRVPLALLALLALLGLLLLVSFARPLSVSAGERGLFLVHGSAGLLSSDGTVAVDYQGGVALVQYSGGIRLALAGPRHWKWSRETARITIGTPAGPATTFNIQLRWLPLWVLIVPTSIACGLVWWSMRKRPGPGECPACGYDVRGLGANRCPECGGAAPAGAAPVASPLP